MTQANKGLAYYFNFYNHNRPHQSLQYRMPYQVHEDSQHVLVNTPKDKFTLGMDDILRVRFFPLTYVQKATLWGVAFC